MEGINDFFNFRNWCFAEAASCLHYCDNKMCICCNSKINLHVVIEKKCVNDSATFGYSWKFPKWKGMHDFFWSPNVFLTHFDYSFLVNICLQILDKFVLMNSWSSLTHYPASNYLFKINNRNTRRCEICSKLTIMTPERRHWPT